MAARDSCYTLSPRGVWYFHFLVSHSATKDLAAGESVERNGTFVPGFRWTARCWPHWVAGDGGPTRVKLSVVVTRANDPWASVPKVVAAHIDLRTRNGTPARTATTEHLAGGGDCIGGAAVLVARYEVEKDCIVDDHFIALCMVTVLDWPPLAIPHLLDVGSDIRGMQDLADVSFQVQGETIRAHRIVLAARSPVFKAELFGEMIESRASCINIEDMSARTFRYMMDYLYTNAVPPALPPGDASANLEARNLFVAADRYGLDKLRQTCQEVLCHGITKETVLSTLEFAEERACVKLKSRCLDFLDVAENFKEVGATDEYFGLMNAYPSLKMEVRNRFKRARQACVTVQTHLVGLARSPSYYFLGSLNHCVLSAPHGSLPPPPAPLPPPRQRQRRRRPALSFSFPTRALSTAAAAAEPPPPATAEEDESVVVKGVRISGRPLYMDMQATTPVDPRVLDAMLPFYLHRYGNPHSRTHLYGWESDAAVEEARARVASLVGADPREIFFTSGATECNNIAVKGVARFYRDRRRHVITTQTEHKCVLDSCRYLQQEGFDVTYLPVRSDGLVDLAQLEEAIRPDTALVSVMAVNNEIGVVQPLEEIGRICKEKGVPMGIGLMSLSAHKIYGPKGVGALYLRRRPRIRVEPQMSGGGQERGIRSGTVPTPLVVGFGAACEIAAKEMDYDHRRAAALQQRLLDGICAQVDEVVINGSMEHRYPGNLNLSFAYVEGESLLMGLKEVAVSSGSACTSASLEPSYVLRALGVEEDMAHTSIRFGIGRFTTRKKWTELLSSPCIR
ncbi:hypothetical protein EJB05_42663, partial [Eragrostis curvula]